VSNMKRSASTLLLMVSAGCSIIAFAFLIAPAIHSSEPDYQEWADHARWAWDDSEATVLHSIERDNSHYGIRLSRMAEHRRHLVIAILEGNKEVYSWNVRRDSVFRIMDDVLYYPLFGSSSQGCIVVAYGLKVGKELWRSPVVGVGPVLHSAYRNQVTIDVDEGIVAIRGHESYGDYLEYKDRLTGKTVAHRIFREGYGEGQHIAKPGVARARWLVQLEKRLVLRVTPVSSIRCTMEATAIAVLFALILLKIALPQPAIKKGQRIGLVQFRRNGTLYFAKIIGDGYLGACVLLSVLLILAGSSLGDQAGKALGVAAVFCPLVSPAVYLLMKPGTDRTIRFCGSAMLAVAWLLMNRPAI